MNPNIVFYNIRLSYQLPNLVNPICSKLNHQPLSRGYIFSFNNPFPSPRGGGRRRGGGIIEALWKQENNTSACKFLRLSQWTFPKRLLLSDQLKCSTTYSCSTRSACPPPTILISALGPKDHPRLNILPLLQPCDVSELKT